MGIDGNISVGSEWYSPVSLNATIQMIGFGHLECAYLARYPLSTKDIARTHD